MQNAPDRMNKSATCSEIDAGLTRSVSPSVRKQLAILASVYEQADAYHRAALEPVIRRAYERAEEART